MKSIGTGRQTGYEFWLSAGNRGGHVVVIDNDKMKFRLTTKDRAGGNGFGLATENVGYTVTVRDRHMVAVFG